MKTKLQFLRWLMMLMFMGSALGVWAQNPNANPAQTVCPGIQPYWVVPDNPNSTFLWTISPAGGWAITPGADDYHISVNWENPVTQAFYTVSIKETTPGPNSCSTTQTVQVTVDPLPTATIAYAGSPYCATGTASVTQTGQAGGTYSSTAGLVINAGTGTIDLAVSAPGTYVVTYNFTNGTCPNAATASMTINTLPDVTIAYVDSPYCATGTTSVIQTGQAGGTYSSTAGLVINAGTGAIDLAASAPGTYIVIYNFTNGTCPNTATASVTINTLPTTSPIWHN